MQGIQNEQHNAENWRSIARMRCDYPRLLAQTLGLKQKDLISFLHGTRLTPQSFAASDTLMSADEQIRVYAIARAMKAPAEIVLLFGRRLTASSHGAVGFMMASSASLLDALQAMVTFMPTRINFLDLTLEQTDNGSVEVVAQFAIDLPPAVAGFLSDTMIAAFYEIASQITMGPLHEVVASLPYKQPSDMTHYRELAPMTYRFSTPRLKVTIPKHLCAAPNAQADSAAFQIARQHCLRLLGHDEPSTTLRARVEQLMLESPPGTISAEIAAEAFFVSARTLARRLAEEGTSFRKIREETLSRQAGVLLQDPRLSVDAVAALLDFHDSASFRRAFKRWFGTTPDAYRKATSKV